MLLSLSSVTNLSIPFGIGAACMLSYRCLQMEWWAAVTVVAIPSQPALLMWPCVSAARPSVLPSRSSRAILHNRHPADCILPIFVRNLTVGVFPGVLPLPSRIVSFAAIGFFVTQIPAQHKPSCILSQYEVCYPCTIMRLVNASPFSFSLIQVF